jgi:hypothetical protein
MKAVQNRDFLSKPVFNSSPDFVFTQAGIPPQDRAMLLGLSCLKVFDEILMRWWGALLFDFG